MQTIRLVTLSAAAMALLGPGLLAAADARRSFDPAQLHEQARIMAAASAGEYRQRAELNERRQQRLMRGAGDGVPAASVTGTREQAQQRVQSRRRLEERLNRQPAYGNAAHGDAARSRSADTRFGQGYEARTSRASGGVAAGPGRTSGGRR